MENILANKEQLFSDFWVIQETRIRNLLKNVPVEKIDIILEKEKKFTKKILDKITTWSNEGNVLIGWDVDDTMGQYRKDKNSNYKFIFRPGFAEFLKYLKEKFPNIKHGLVTDRSKEEVAESFESGGHFYDLRDLFNKDYRLDVKNENNRRLSDEATKHFGEHKSLIVGLYKKMNAMSKVLELNPNINFKLIDDYLPVDIKEALGDNGLSVSDCIPRETINILNQAQ